MVQDETMDFTVHFKFTCSCSPSHVSCWLTVCIEVYFNFAISNIIYLVNIIVELNVVFRAWIFV